MGLVSLYIATSLDGMIAGQHESLDWLPAEGAEDYGYSEYFRTVRAIVMGSSTYETAARLNDGRWPYGRIDTYVVTKQKLERYSPSVSFIREDVASSVRELAARTSGRVWVVGGAKLAGLLMDTRVIEEVIVTVIPVILGRGVGLFDHVQDRRQLRLESLERWQTGVVQLSYEIER